MSKDGGPAFPVDEVFDENRGVVIRYMSSGLSLRDYFAAAALNGILSNAETMRQGVLLTKDMKGNDALLVMNSLLAYGYADAMLRARES